MRVAFLSFAAAFAAAFVVASEAPAYAQKPADHIALGVAAQKAIKPEEALQHFQAALAADSLNYEANWRAALAVVEFAQQSSGATTSPAQLSDPADTASAKGEAKAAAEAAKKARRNLLDSLYRLAETYARRALDIDRKPTPGHFAVALALSARTTVSDPATILSLAEEIWQESSDAILLDPKHDGAYHILGQWYASVMRLSEAQRNYVIGALGEIAENATWELALENLGKAVELAPSVAFHRLDLARAYLDVGRPDDAKAQLVKIESLPIVYAPDPEYKAQAKSLLEKLQSGEKPQP